MVTRAHVLRQGSACARGGGGYHQTKFERQIRKIGAAIIVASALPVLGGTPAGVRVQGLNGGGQDLRSFIADHCPGRNVQLHVAGLAVQLDQAPCGLVLDNANINAVKHGGRISLTSNSILGSTTERA